MSYLYSKLPETGVSPHIGTGGTCRQPLRQKSAIGVDLSVKLHQPISSMGTL
jgi:hypothetical protein